MTLLIQEIIRMINEFKEKYNRKPNILLCSIPTYDELMKAVFEVYKGPYYPYDGSILKFMDMQIICCSGFKGKYIRLENDKLEKYQDVIVGEIGQS